MLNVGITGADGFIGGNLVESLKLNKKIKIKVFDENFTKLKDINTVKNFAANLDVVIHLAGAVIGTDEAMNFNIYSAYNLIKSFENKKKIIFIFFSTTQVYGYSSKKNLINESSKVNPVNYHSATKFLAEQLLLNSKNIYPVILRSSNVYGFGARPFYNSAVATFIENILNKNKIVLNNKGLQKRNFIYIKDVCKIIEKIILTKNFSKGIYNLTSSESIRICDIVKYIEEFAGERADIGFKSIKENYNFSVIDNSKILKELSGFEFTEFKAGIKEYIDEYRKSRGNKIR